MRSCVIRRNKEGRVSDVTTQSGAKSKLFPALASIATIENREHATSLLKKVFSPSFLKRFGDWMKGRPRNPKMYKEVVKNIGKVPSEFRDAVLQKARMMDNPILAGRVNPPGDTIKDGLSYYSTDAPNPVLFDAVSMRRQDLSGSFVPTGMTTEEYEDMVIRTNTGYVLDFTGIDGSHRYVLSRVVPTYEPSSLTYENEDAGITYDTGEPKLFFMNGDGNYYESYGDALLSSTNPKITAGFLKAGAEQFFHGKPKVGTEKYFIPLIEFPASTDTSTREGMINYLIKKGYLSGSKRYDSLTGTYHLTGAGAQDAVRIFNSALALDELQKRGIKDVQMDERGNITLSQRDKTKVGMIGPGGTRLVKKDDILQEVKNGGYNRLSNEYHYFDETFLALLLEKNPLQAEQRIIPNLAAEDLEQKNAIISILKSLGVSVMGMSDYLEKYQTKYGEEPSARALADMANGVVALAEGATIDDLIEETAHFLVEAYANQSEINDVLQEVENTEMWASQSKHYYEIYGKALSGEELDTAVRREILGKLLRDRLIEATRTERRDNRTFLGRLGSLALNMVESLRSMFSTQRSDLNRVIDRISELALSDRPTGFNTSLLKESPWVLYSSEERSRSKFLRDRINRLRSSVKKLRQIDRSRGVSSSFSLERIAGIESKLKSVSSDITDSEVLATAEGIINSASAAVRYIKNVIDSNERTGNQLSPEDRMNMRIINEEILPNLVSMRGFVQSGMQLDHPEKLSSVTGSADMQSIRDDYTTRIDNVISDIHSLTPRIESSLSRDTESLVDNLLDRFNVPVEHREGIHKALSGVLSAGNFLARWFGILEHSSNPVNGMLGALIAEDNMNAMRDTEHDLDPFLKKVHEGKWNTARFESLIQQHKGKYSNFLKGPLRMAEFEHDYKVAQIRALAKTLPEFAEIVGYDSKSNTFNEDKVEEVASMNDPLSFTIKEMSDDGRIVDRMVKFKPSLDRINLDLLDAAGEQRFNDYMKEWESENLEQPYTEGYETFYDGIYNALQKRGIQISQRTKDFLRAQSRSRYMIRQPFFREDGSFDYVRYYQSGAAEDVLNLRKERKLAASDYMYIGGQRILKDKDSDEWILAKELQAIDEEIRNRHESNGGDYKMSGEFLEAVRAAQEGSEERAGSAEDAWRVLSYGGYISFSDKFWNEIGLGQESRTEANNKLSFERLADDILANSIETIITREELNEITSRIKANQQAIREIISANRDTSNPGETSFDTLTRSEQETILSLSESIEADYSELMRRGRDANLDLNEYLQRSSESENMVNEAYRKAFKDSGIKEEWRFATRHMTPRKRERVMNLKRKMDKLKDNRFNFSPAEREFLAEELGITSWDDASDFRKKANIALEQTTREQRDGLLSKYARRMVLPYFKRMAPAGYSAFMDKIAKNQVDISEFANDLQNGIGRGESIDKYGFDISYLSYSPNREALAEESIEESGHNPNYNPDFGLGWKIPKFSKYLDKDYFDYFGIKEGDLFGKATRNTEEFDMLESLKEINRNAYSKYGEKGRNIYQIPQISKGTVERFAQVSRGLDATKGVIMNYVRDLVTDRVDDSIYGRVGQEQPDSEYDRIKAVPKYYINQLENQDDVSHDLAYSFSMLASQANLYKYKSATLSDALGLQQIMLNSQFENGKRPEATQAYAMFKDFMESHYYGIQVNNKKITWNFGGWEVDVTKLVHLFNKWMSMMNLALSPFVAATGALTGQANFLIEGAAGQYMDMDSARYAYKEVARLLPKYAMSAGSLYRQDKLYVIGENLGVYQMRSRLYGAGYGRATRLFMRDAMYKFMEVANAPLDPQVMVAVMDGVRYYKDSRMQTGRFFTKAELKDYLMKRDGSAPNFKETWKSLRGHSLWNSIDTDGSEVVPKQGLNIDADVMKEFYGRRNKIRSVIQICDGALNEENRVGATRNILGQLTTAHRGWMFLAAQRLWKRRGYNFQTLQYEEGLTRSLGSFFRSAIAVTRERDQKDLASWWKAIESRMDPVQAQNIWRGAVYLSTVALLAIIARLLQGYRDDDDNDDSGVGQFFAYIGMRTINETVSQMPGFYALNLIDAAEDPFVIARKAGELFNLENISTNRVTSGTYAGETKLWRTICKLSFLKQWYNIKTPEAIRKSSDWWLQNNSKSMMFFMSREKPDDTVNFDAFAYPNLR